jgi:hypothetical protein
VAVWACLWLLQVLVVRDNGHDEGLTGPPPLAYPVGYRLVSGRRGGRGGGRGVGYGCSWALPYVMLQPLM